MATFTEQLPQAGSTGYGTVFKIFLGEPYNDIPTMPAWALASLSILLFLLAVRVSAQEKTLVAGLLKDGLQRTECDVCRHARGGVAAFGDEPEWDNFWLAGDWTDTGLPATIEGAILSGERAARAVDGRDSF